MQQKLLLLTLAGAVTAQEILIPNNEVVSAGTYRHYLGHGRAASFRVSDTCGVETRLAYAFPASNHTCTVNNGTCVAEERVHECVAVRRGEDRHCVAIQNVVPITFPPVEGTPAPGSTPTPARFAISGDFGQQYFYSPLASQIQGYKGYGDRSFEWFVEYTLQTDSTTACQTILDQGVAIDPAKGFCLRPNDTQYVGKETDEVSYFAHGAELLRGEFDKYVIDTVIVGGDVPGFSRSGRDTTINTHFWDLGLGPRVELSCLNVFITNQDYIVPSLTNPSECEAMGTGLDASAGEDQLWDFHLVDAPDCNTSGRSVPCCRITDADECQATRNTVSSNTTNCYWIQRETEIPTKEQGWCVPLDDVSFIDLKGSGVIGSTETYVFNSHKANTPDSSLITSPDEFGWSSELQRRWFLRFTNRATAFPTPTPQPTPEPPATPPPAPTPAPAPTPPPTPLPVTPQPITPQPPATPLPVTPQPITPEPPATPEPTDPAESCPLSVTTSFVSHPTGGICEPATRMMCDAMDSQCVTGDLTLSPRYWKQNKPPSEYISLIADKEYKTCNCLKQKEVCYRKNGCMSTKKYLLLLQNCLEQGCGNYCNSGAAVTTSIVTLVFALMLSIL